MLSFPFHVSSFSSLVYLLLSLKKIKQVSFKQFEEKRSHFGAMVAGVDDLTIIDSWLAWVRRVSGRTQEVAKSERRVKTARGDSRE